MVAVLRKSSASLVSFFLNSVFHFSANNTDCGLCLWISNATTVDISNSLSRIYILLPTNSAQHWGCQSLPAEPCALINMCSVSLPGEGSQIIAALKQLNTFADKHNLTACCFSCLPYLSKHRLEVARSREAFLHCALIRFILPPHPLGAFEVVRKEGQHFEGSRSPGTDFPQGSGANCIQKK